MNSLDRQVMPRWLASLLFCVLMTFIGAGFGFVLGVLELFLLSGPQNSTADILLAITFGGCTLGGLLFGIFAVVFGSKSQG